MKKLMAALALAVCCAGIASAAFKFSRPSDLKIAKIGVQSGSIAEELGRDLLGRKASTRLISYEEVAGIMDALKTGKVHAAILDEAPALQFVKESNGQFVILPEAMTSEEYAIGLKKGNNGLLAEVNKALAEIKADGTLENIMRKYKEGDGLESVQPRDIDYNYGAKGGQLSVGTEPGFPPYEVKVGTGYIGIDIEMCAAIAKRLDKELVVVAYPFDMLFSAVDAGQVDLICAGITVNDERRKSTGFSEPYEHARQVCIVTADEYVAK